jgi:hypothetical protein
MKNLKEFVAYLEKDHHPDAWADYASDNALPLLENFTDEEWEALKTLWPQKSAAWQERLASIVGVVNPKVSLQILEDMVFGENVRVSLRALYFLENSEDIYRPSPKMLEWLRDKLENDWEYFGKDTLQTILSFSDLGPL